jgi:hypothetical protein
MAGQNVIDSLKTHKQRFKDKKWDKMFIPKSTIMSKAWLSLKTAAACQVYMIFRTKCQWKPFEGKRKYKNNYILANQGEIQFTYKEAEEKWGISQSKFTRAIDEVIRVGLIDIAHSGFGLQKDATLYAISDRWEKFGTDEFVVKERERRKQHIGFAKGNSYGKNNKKKTTFMNNS